MTLVTHIQRYKVVYNDTSDLHSTIQDSA